jgi:uncharacterized protein YndB with AHSA1/START domain
MSRLGRFSAMALAAGLAACATGSADQSEVGFCPVIAERELCHAVVIDAPAAEVWPLIATSEGWRSWAAPVAEVDLRVGGEIETSYDRNARIGGPGNIHNRIVSFEPNRSLVIQIAQAPPGFPHAEEARNLSTALELEPRGSRTLVRVRMSGFREGEAYDALFRFFDAGNAYTLNKLVERIENGPTNWAEQR